MAGDLHVVFGAGQVGTHLAERLVASGERLRVAKRSPSRVPAGAELVLGDAADLSFRSVPRRRRERPSSTTA
jgi:uncharacterized protein YbjT (DUF2867 family)